MDRPHCIVIGGGPGGNVAALRAAQLEMQVTLIEKDRLGGICLNEGCIPTKSLLHGASYLSASREAAGWGVVLGEPAVSFSKMQQKKEEIVKRLTDGVGHLLRAAGVRVIAGEAFVSGKKEVTVVLPDQTRECFTADRIILATGSVPSVPHIPGLSLSSRILDSSAALSLREIPESLLILGGGVIGMELACLFNSLGTAVTVLEAMPKIVPPMDDELSGSLQRILSESGIAIHTGCRAESVSEDDSGVTVTAAAAGGERKIFKAEKLIVAIGRKPLADAAQLHKAGIKTENGRILVDEFLETSVPGIYAVGDCNGLLMLAHAASAQGEIAAENAAQDCGGLTGKSRTFSGKKPYIPDFCPSCLYTAPECAFVGLTEEAAKEKGIPYHVGRFPLSGNGRALTLGTETGFVKVLIGDVLGEILGVHMMGPQAPEIIGEAAAVMLMEGCAEDLIRTVHAHPTVSEALREAVLDAEGRPVHKVKRKYRQ